MDEDLKAFYEYHACLMEPWDGPASIAFTNGTLIGAVLDRNGLRPSRYYVTKDDLVIMASEVGVLPIEPENIAKKWRLQPGKIFLIDMKQGRIIDDSEIKRELVDKRPWKQWLDENLVELDDLPEAENVHAAGSRDAAGAPARLRLHGRGPEDADDARWRSAGQEPIGSMGTDTPLACLSDRPQLLYNYFKQLFAQVTNPPLDANLRGAGHVAVHVPRPRGQPAGRDAAALPPGEAQDADPLQRRAGEAARGATSATCGRSRCRCCSTSADGEGGLQKALDELCEAAAKAVKDGASILILSDRGVDHDHAPIPALLATAAVHHHLIREGTRTQAGLVIETGEAREIHHFCLLIGYGAGAVNPYLAFETLADLHREGLLPKDLTLEKAKKNYIKAANKGIIKVASKMGISHGAELPRRADLRGRSA